MKLDKKYFKLRARQLDLEFLNRITILKQIAHDARMEQAKVDREAVEKCGDGRDGDGDACILNALAALAAVAPEDEK